jgi:hypothetical protein
MKNPIKIASELLCDCLISGEIKEIFVKARKWEDGKQIIYFEVDFVIPVEKEIIDTADHVAFMEV